MESNKKKVVWVLVVVVAIIVIVGIIVAVRQGGVSSQKAGGPGGSNGPAQLPLGESTRSAAPVTVVVPGQNASSVPANVAVPKTVAPANPSNTASFRSYDIKIDANQFTPNTVIVNQWDTIHMNLTAVDKDYDFTQPDFGFKFPIPKGTTHVLEFSATGQGKFSFYCSSCGGPAQGPVGYIVVTVPKQ